ncbi:MAG: Spo0E family sporulation regulatory protein-aspartic acid phosphatase [Neobacillus sp.]
MNSMLIIDERVSKKELLEVIKSLRITLIQIGIELGLSNEKTIEISQRLDTYIAKYQTLKNY